MITTLQLRKPSRWCYIVGADSTLGITNTDSSLEQNTSVTKSDKSASTSTSDNSVKNDTTTDSTTNNMSQNASTGKTSNTGSTSNTGLTASSGLTTNDGSTSNESAGSQTTTGLLQTTGTTTSTTGSSDASIASAQSLLDQANNNSVDGSKTSGLVQNILTQAALTFAPNLTKAPTAGIYNATSTGLLQGNAEAQATAQAAGAVLNYQTQQQNLAAQASSNLLQATKTTTGSTTGAQTDSQAILNSLLTSGLSTNTGSSTNTGAAKNTGNTTSDGTSSSDSITSSLTNILSNVSNAITQKGNSSNNSSSDSAQAGTVVQNSSSTGETGQVRGGLGLSVVCTELMRQNKMPRALWLATMREFQEYPECGKQAYYRWATPVVAELKAHPDSLVSRLAEKLFVARAKNARWARTVAIILTYAAGLTSIKCLMLLFTVDFKLLSLFSEKDI